MAIEDIPMLVHFTVNGTDHSLGCACRRSRRARPCAACAITASSSATHRAHRADATPADDHPDQPVFLPPGQQRRHPGRAGRRRRHYYGRGPFEPPATTTFIRAPTVHARRNRMRPHRTPVQLLAAKKLLDENPSPSEAEVREALAGVLCRCTGYVSRSRRCCASRPDARAE